MAILRFRIPGRIFLPIIGLLSLGLMGCHDAGPRVEGDIYGRVISPDGQTVFGASVFLGRRFDYFSSPRIVIMDSTLTDRSGQYLFTGLTDQIFSVYAGVWDRGHLDFTAVSPFDPTNDFQPYQALTPNPPPHDLTVYEIQRRGVVAGHVEYFDGMKGVPADSAEVTLQRYRGAQLVVEGSAWTNAAGDFAIPSVQTGNYLVHASKVFRSQGPFLSYVVAESGPIFCDGTTMVWAPDLVMTEVAVEKPAIYIYPAQPGPHHVRLDLGEGVSLTRSIPAYGDGWDVFIDREGRIDRQWDYLFYEISLPGSPLLRGGWCLDGQNVRGGLERIVRQLGLNDGESRDFLDYWTRRLPRSPWVVVKPVMGADLDHLARLRVEPAPDTVLRFWLLFSGSAQFVEMPAPVVEPRARRGGVLVEWGGAVVPAPR